VIIRIAIEVPKSGSGSDQRDHPEHDDPNRQQCVRDLVDAVHPALEQRRDEEDRHQLRQLRRLDPDAADAEPAARAVDRRAEVDGDEREDDQRPARSR